MTKHEIETMTKILQLVVRKEIKSLKNEIISEISNKVLRSSNASKQSLVEDEIHKRFRTNHKVQQRKPIYSKDPYLNELLSSTDPVPVSEYDFDNIGINLPTNAVGMPIAPTNDKMNSVISAMNRDYSELVERMDEGKAQQRGEFRKKIISRIENDDEPDEEDFSWLNEVG